MNGALYAAYEGNEGMNSLSVMLDSREDKFDLWLIFELCGSPLSKTLFQVKGEFYKGERIY